MIKLSAYSIILLGEAVEINNQFRILSERKSRERIRENGAERFKIQSLSGSSPQRYGIYLSLSHTVINLKNIYIY